MLARAIGLHAAFAPTFTAAPQQLVDVRGELEVVLHRELTLQLLDGIEAELDHLAADGTDEVVVVFALERDLIAVPLARQERRLEQAGLEEKREHAVDGRHRGFVDAVHPEDPHEVLDLEVTRIREGRPHDRAADVRHLQRLFGEGMLEVLESTAQSGFELVVVVVGFAVGSHDS